MSIPQYLRQLLEANSDHEHDTEEYLLREHEVLILLQGWRMFLLVAASQSVSRPEVICKNDYFSTCTSYLMLMILLLQINFGHKHDI